MPPKRPASSQLAPQNRRKKVETVARDCMVPSAHRPRWSKVSGSANAEEGFKVVSSDPAEAYKYICFCKRAFEEGKNNDEEDEEEEQEAQNKSRCDGGETCICSKPATEHPEHPWIATAAGVHKTSCIKLQDSLRIPDHFNMYLYNDFHGYGVIELAQNLLLDFYQAKDDLKAQWSLCEAVVFFFLHGLAEPLMRVDDGEEVDRIGNLIRIMFLTMLAKLERNDLLKAESEIKNLRLIMAQYIGIPGEYPELLENDIAEMVLAYAKKHSLDLHGFGADGHIDNLKDIPLPAYDAENEDPWDWEKALDHHDRKFGPIGGDKYDITAWTSAERKRENGGRDPLRKPEIDALKSGMIMQRA